MSGCRGYATAADNGRLKAFFLCSASIKVHFASLIKFGCRVVLAPSLAYIYKSKHRGYLLLIFAY